MTALKQLTVMFNGRRQAAYLLDLPEVVIGRGRSAHVPLDDNPIVSRKHAVIRSEGAHHIIEDSGGANGTYVNDVAITKTRLHDGDRIVLGKHTLRYEAGAPGAASLKARALNDTEGAAAAATAAAMKPLEESKVPAPPWQENDRKPPPVVRGGGGSELQGSERTVAASKEELESLLEQMKIKSGAHLSVPVEGELKLVSIDKTPALIGWTDECLVRLPGNKWFGKVAARIEKRKGKWWIHAGSPFWSPVQVGNSKLQKKRKLTGNAVIAVGKVKIRFSTGEAG